MVSTAIIQQVEAAPKDDKINSHSKSTYDPGKGNYDYRSGHNFNGPSGHENCKYTYDSSTDDYDSRCINN